MKAQYIRLMDALHRACLVIAGACLVVITLIIPWGVFTRFVLNSASSWPEPLAVLLMIVLSFFSAIICYREYLHIGVGVLPALLGERDKAILGVLIEICMMATNVFMVWYGVKLVQTTMYQSIAEFPWLSVGFSYLPVTIAGAVTMLFIVERFLTREFFREQTIETTSTVATE
ncbi:MAG: TRAP transporter small permease [Microvirga sp.]|jgi:TRAP-type C4-dicarboxylate transport system permease small subunit